MKQYLTLAVLSFWALGAGAPARAPIQVERPVFGSISELKGMAKVYVTAPSSKQRDTIIRSLKKSDLVVVGSPAEAEFFLEYRIVKDHREFPGMRETTVNMSAYTIRGEQRRIAWFKSTSPPDHPEESRLARDFLKALKANKH